MLLGPVLGTLPVLVFQQEVLQRLGPTDLASLAGAGRGCAAAVAATTLMQWAKRAKSTAAPRQAWFGQPLPLLCLKEACSHAAYGGNREVLEWLHNTGCPWDAVTTCAAAAGGHLEVLTWLHKHGCPLNAWTCENAARFGNLAVLQWAREHHCPWNWRTPANAAHGGQLAVLQWAREHHCPWDAYVCMDAADAGQLEVLQWVREHDTTGDVWDEDLVRRHAKVEPRKQEVITWLDELSAP